MPLTDTRLRALKPKDKPYKVTDERGLYVEVTPTGGKLWRFRYRIGGAQKKLCIGSYPEISLKQARDAAYEARRAVASGGDPAFEKRKRKIRAEFLSAQTFEAVAREYIEQMMVQNGRADGTIVKANYFLDKLAPAIGNRPIHEIEPFEVLAPLKRLEATGKHETAKKCRSFAGRVFRYGVATTRCKSDPTSMLNVWARAIEGASVTVWHVFEFPSIGRLRSQAPNWPHAVSLQCPARASSLRTRVEHEFCPWPCGPSVGATSHQTRKEIIMARSNTAPAQETNPPEFLAWHVANKGDKGFWTRIGAAWFHRDRKGLSLQLEVVPINGRIVLRTPLDDEKKEPGA